MQWPANTLFVSFVTFGANSVTLANLCSRPKICLNQLLVEIAKNELEDNNNQIYFTIISYVSSSFTGQRILQHGDYNWIATYSLLVRYLFILGSLNSKCWFFGYLGRNNKLAQK